ncbi:hypothetical protein E8E13_009440 [Curvularia kusanoi]|uniref:SWIM-type domain-containing protein n=1 Tax=Curvularia kusanoi TaxID=90978 RepID=A0A9P4WB90_CURKU|nr:hypothetical protein E8E13_009440 [Curvularia kusanoi]
MSMSISMSALPSPRDFVTRLLASLPSAPPAGTEASPLRDAPEPVKKQLLSLQVLFPNEFLPALDVLDRRLISRFHIGNEDANTSNATTTSTSDVHTSDAPTSLSETIVPEPSHSTTDTVHYVRSAQHRASRFSASYDSTTSYEVRLRAWNCTCPAFAFAAFPALHPEPPLPLYVAPSVDTRPHPTATDEEDKYRDGGRDRVVAEHPEPDTYAGAHVDADAEPPPLCHFGGVTAGASMPPVCKHLLACVLAEHCPGLFGSCVEERRVGVESAAGWAAGWGDV